MSNSEYHGRHNPYEGQQRQQQPGGQYGQGNVHGGNYDQYSQQQGGQQQQQQQPYYPPPQQQQQQHWDQPPPQQYPHPHQQHPHHQQYQQNSGQGNYQNQQQYQNSGQLGNGLGSGNNSFAGAPIRAGVNVGSGSLGSLPSANRGPVSPTNAAAGPSDSVRPVPSGTQRVCRHFLQGKCTWGDSCRFLHDASKVSESNPPLSPPGSPPIVPPPMHVGHSPGILSVGNPHSNSGNQNVYGSQDCLPPALSGVSPNQGGHLSSAPSSPMGNGSFGPHDVQPNVVIRSRASSQVLKSPMSGSQPGSRPLSPGAGGSQRYAHNPYGDQQLTPNGAGSLEPPSGY